LNDFYSMAYSATFDDQDNLYVADLNRTKVLIYKNPFNSIPPPRTPTPLPPSTITPSPPPVVGGHGFSLETSPGEAVHARWNPGTLQTGYQGIRIALPGGATSLFPDSGQLAPTATGFDDFNPVDIACYTVLVYLPGTTGSVSGPPNTDGLCLFRSVASGNIPQHFKIQLNESPSAALTWNPPLVGGQTGYTLVIIPTDGSPITTQTLGAGTASTTHNTGGHVVCYQLQVTGGGGGQTDALCAFPGASTLSAGTPSPSNRVVQRIRTEVGMPPIAHAPLTDR
jgi:hypothetical protein